MPSKKTPLTIILGIDPGIADTGWGLIKKNQNGELACLAYGTIKTPAGQKLPIRLETLNAELEKIIKKYRPSLCGVEELFFCNNVKTALTVGQARGVILLTARQNQLPVAEFTPLQIKQAVSTYGKAGKKQVQAMVKLLLNLKEIPKPDDAADALAVAICTANSAPVLSAPHSHHPSDPLSHSRPSPCHSRESGNPIKSTE